ncbi:response regulator [Nitratidesulfovibrio sp. HK-II]|uniref:response regulator n=1 Tax=Nitratidesulfovibrio sp. HK-II TaxID=2009266 RepID=UPI000E2F10C1|nr:response regulator [Nitratidesulfovibrio sp. HK-II]GBO96300.1 response regulator [Nitratidesulfovibrio sp. HK-II]
MSNADILILVVDDEEMVRENLEAYLEDEGFRVVTAGSGEEALDLLAHHRPDVGIIDMRLPGMSGNDFIIRAHQVLPTLRYLIHTGSTNYKLPSELIAIGVERTDIHIKPLQNMDDLVQGIYRRLAAPEQA